MTTPIVLHNPAAQRFEADVGGPLAVCSYRRFDGVLRLTHTEVPRALQGRGIAAALVRSALAWARAEGLLVRPACAAFMQLCGSLYAPPSRDPGPAGKLSRLLQKLLDDGQ